MNFEKYEQLSEDAQRLMCFYADVGLGSNRRMDEQLYILSQYCFPTFNGKAALSELTDKGILDIEGKDWYTNMPRYSISLNDFVPALWFLYECRKDLLLAFQKVKHMSGQTYMFIRYAVHQLVESGYQQCNSANVIGVGQVEMFNSIAAEPQFLPLFINLQAESFVYFFEHIGSYLTMNDMVIDPSTILTANPHYRIFL